ncbi:sugar phosphate isomerase/epimerase family protein [Gordoniibacillus kamchatkensis]|uniref:sugar phosphate isomerase/epimerase family protein n=1 Tax=Gordoniibacillus kamchatkensis TaxID=1590651 RepID=UPI000B18C17A|nr:TIM barrel protein [Paenibacillus sp. VKM B-2647]
MKLGMPTLIEFGSLEQNVGLCRELGLHFIELNMNLPIFTPERLDAKRLRAWAQDSGIGFTIHLPEELDLSSFHPSIRKGHIERCKESMAWAAAVGVTVLNMHLNPGIYFTLPKRKVWINERYESEFVSALDESYSELYALAESLQLQLCIENTYNFHLPFVRSALERLQSYTAFRLTWDVGHDAKAGFAEEPVLLAYRDRIRHMHLHDCSAASDHQPLYTGNVPIGDRLRLARDLDLGVIIEVKTAEALRQSVHALRDRGEWMDCKRT